MHGAANMNKFLGMPNAVSIYIESGSVKNTSQRMLEAKFRPRLNRA
jgi:hypothetical protein